MNLAFTYIMYAAIMAAGTVGLFVAYVQTGSRRYSLDWALFAVFWMANLAVNALLSLYESPLLVALGHLLAMAAYLLLGIGMLRYTRGSLGRLGRVYVSVSAGLELLILLLIFLALPRYAVRNTVYTLYCVGVFLFVAAVLYSSRDERERGRNWFGVASAVLVAVAWLVRAVFILIFPAESILEAHPAVAAANIGLSFAFIIFLLSLFNLGQQRVKLQLDSVGDWVRRATTANPQLNTAVSGIAHSLGSPLGSAITGLSSLTPSLSGEEQEMARRVLEDLEAAGNRMQHLRTLYAVNSDPEARSVELPEVARGMAEMLDAPYRVGRQGPGPLVAVNLVALLHLVKQLKELASHAGWLRSDLEVRTDPAEAGAIHLSGLAVPPDIWRDSHKPMTRSQVRGFVDSVLLGALRSQFRQSAGVRDLRRPGGADALVLSFVVVAGGDDQGRASS